MSFTVQGENDVTGARDIGGDFDVSNAGEAKQENNMNMKSLDINDQDDGISIGRVTIVGVPNLFKVGFVWQDLSRFYVVLIGVPNREQI